MTSETTSQAFFEKIYRTNPDPWDFASSDYELARYRAILDALDERRYGHAFEPGCSIGVLTRQLAARCDRVDAIDISPRAVELALRRCSTQPNVHIVCSSLQDAFATSAVEGPFDLIVFSEIGYYFEEDALRHLLTQLVGSLQPRGTLLACHWLGFSPDHILSGDRVHQLIAGIEGLTHNRGERHQQFRLDRWSRQ